MYTLTLEQVLNNVTTPSNWATSEELLDVISRRPSLRGMVYGYVAELKFAEYLRDKLGIVEQTVDDDHKKTKSDITFVYNGRRYTAQVKCLQTTLIKEIGRGIFEGKAQNDASDKRLVILPNGDRVMTTCYVAGEYDILVTTLQPFLGSWEFVYKKNKDLTRSSYSGYTEEQKKYLLATTEKIRFPSFEEMGWSDNLLNLLTDRDLGTPTGAAQVSEGTEVEIPSTGEKIKLLRSKQ